MIKYKVLLILFFTNSIILSSQDDMNELFNIKNIVYGGKQEVIVIKPVYRDIITAGVQTYFAKGIKAAIQGTSLTSNISRITIVDKPTNQYSFNVRDFLFSNEIRYVANWDIAKLDFYEYKEKGKTKTRITLSSSFNITDIVNGVLFVSKTINYNEDIEGTISEYQIEKSYSKLLKKVKSDIRQSIKAKMPEVKLISSIHEAKKDKAKSVILAYINKSLKKRRLYVSVFEKAIEKNGETIYIYKNLGQIKYNKQLKGSHNKHIFKVKNGKKEILNAFNTGQKLFVTKIKIGY